MMQKYMPLIFGFIYLNVAAILNVYFIVSSGIRILTQEILFRRGHCRRSACDSHRTFGRDQKGTGRRSHRAGLAQTEGEPVAAKSSFRHQRVRVSWDERKGRVERKGRREPGEDRVEQRKRFRTGKPQGTGQGQQRIEGAGVEWREPIPTEGGGRATSAEGTPPVEGESANGGPGNRWIGLKPAESHSRKQKRSCWTCWESQKTTLNSSFSANRRPVSSVGSGARPVYRLACGRSLPHPKRTRRPKGDRRREPSRNGSAGNRNGRNQLGRDGGEGSRRSGNRVASEATVIEGSGSDGAPEGANRSPAGAASATGVSPRDPADRAGAGAEAVSRVRIGPTVKETEAPVVDPGRMRARWKSH